MDSEIIELFPTTFYKTKIKIDENSFEILEFKLLKKSNYTLFLQEEFNADICLANTDPKDLLNIKNTLLEKIKNQDYDITVEYSFKDKDGKTLRFKDKLSLINKNENIYEFYGVGIDITKEYELTQILEKINDSNIFGIVIFKDNNIIYANNKFKEIFKIPNFTNEKLSDFIPLDLIEDKQYLRNPLMLKNRDNEKIFIKFFRDQILFNNQISEILIIIDYTKEEKELLNHILINHLFEEITLNKIDIKKLLKILNKFYSSVYFCDENFKTITKAGKSVKLDFSNLTKRTLKKPKIINNLQSRFKSLLIIPLINNNETKNYLLIFSEYKNEFINFTAYAQKIQKIFEFVLKNS